VKLWPIVCTQEIIGNINELIKDTRIDNKKVSKYLRNWKPAHETSGPPDDRGVKVAFEYKVTAENMRFIFCIISFKC